MGNTLSEGASPMAISAMSNYTVVPSIISAVFHVRQLPRVVPLKIVKTVLRRSAQCNALLRMHHFNSRFCVLTPFYEYGQAFRILVYLCTAKLFF
jgi:hypothetical protein